MSLRTPIPRPCDFCKKMYVGYGRCFCSKSCRAKALGWGHGKKTGSFVNCGICGKKIWRKGHLVKISKSHYCSYECLGVANGKRINGTRRFNHWMFGNKNNSWKGGVTPLNMKIRRSAEMVAWRKAVFERDKYTCQMCGQVGGQLCADHVKPFADFPELRFDISNGRTLCKTCHKKTPTYGWSAYWASRRRKRI